MKKYLILTLFLLLLTIGCTKIEEPKINSTTTVQDLAGKPTAILIGGTYCPHCRTSAPQFKTEIQDAYKGKVYTWVNVVDQKEFTVDDLIQGYNQNLNYEPLTGSYCRYVPSWVILDAEGNLADKSCGSEKSFVDMKTTLDSLIME